MNRVFRCSRKIAPAFGLAMVLVRRLRIANDAGKRTRNEPLRYKFHAIIGAPKVVARNLLVIG